MEAMKIDSPVVGSKRNFSMAHTVDIILGVAFVRVIELEGCTSTPLSFDIRSHLGHLIHIPSNIMESTLAHLNPLGFGQ